MLPSIAGWLKARRMSVSLSKSQCRGLGVSALALVAGVIGFGALQEAQAAPAFARQTGMACSACHFQNFPILNSFGRAFKAAGYTLTGKQEMIEDEGLSLPATLNASLITKLRWQKTNGSLGAVKNTGELQLPDEAALLIGGRAGEHVGFLLEAQMGDPDAPMWASYKMPITFKKGDTDLSIIPFATDAAGAGYGLELLNTGALRPQRVGEDRSAMMAQQWLGLGSGAAEGVAFAAANDKGFVNVSLWVPHFGNYAFRSPALYVRAAWTPSIGNWDAGVGIQHFSGKAVEGAPGAKVETKTSGFAIDGQLQGEIGGMPLGVYAAYGQADAGTFFNGTAFDKTAWSIHGQLGVIPGKVTLIAGYKNGDTGAATANEDNAFTIGGTWQFAQNVQLQINHAMYSGNKYDTADADAQTTFMLFTAF
jgi:hypothetical protein